MLEDLLEYHQIPIHQVKETVDLNVVLKEVKQPLFEKLTVKNAQVITQQLPVVKGSYAGLRQVFQNLISNAIKFVEEGRAPYVSITAEEYDHHYTLAVKDNGIVIAENQD